LSHLISKKVLIMFVMLSLAPYAFAETEKTSDRVLQNTMIDIVAQANSKDDHERIAARYDDETRSLLKNASRHEELALIYEQTEKTQKTWRSNAARHCKMIAQKIQEVAVETSALSDLHRQLAKELDK
jgi:hypothetical protein